MTKPSEGAQSADRILSTVPEQPVKKYPTIVARVSEAQKEKFYALGGADWLRKKIESGVVKAS